VNKRREAVDADRDERSGENIKDQRRATGGGATRRCGRALASRSSVRCQFSVRRPRANRESRRRHDESCSRPHAHDICLNIGPVCGCNLPGDRRGALRVHATFIGNRKTIFQSHAVQPDTSATSHCSAHRTVGSGDGRAGMHAPCDVLNIHGAGRSRPTLWPSRTLCPSQSLRSSRSRRAHRAGGPGMPLSCFSFGRRFWAPTGSAEIRHTLTTASDSIRDMFLTGTSPYEIASCIRRSGWRRPASNQP
jgi:hypothetical protein